MILTDDDVRIIIKNNPAKADIKAKTDKHKKLNMHVNGIGLDKYIMSLKFFERDEVKKERIKLMRPNVDIVARCLKPRDKIFTAKGGVEEYNLSDRLISDFRDYLSDITEGLSLKKWMQNVCVKKYDTDPDGVILIELGEPSGNMAIPYPVYKCIDEIYDYKLNGRQPEYLVLICSPEEIAEYQAQGFIPNELRKGQKVYRVIDDTSDRLCITNVQGQPSNISIPDSARMPNYFMKVPARIISDLNGVDNGCYESPLAKVVWLLDAYLLKGSTYELAELYQAYAKMWIQKTDCATCAGEGEINGEKCPECKGSGMLPDLKISDTLITDYSASDAAKMPNPPLGYVVPPVEGLQYLGQRHASLEELIYYTIWGVYKVDSSTKPIGGGVSGGGNNTNGSGTAYEASLNQQPKHDSMYAFTEWYQDMYKFIADLCGEIRYTTAYKGSAILGGDRYQNEGADAVWDKYQKAVSSNAPQAILDSMLIEYIEGKFSANPIQFRKYLLLMKVEPFVHMAVSDVVALPIPDIQKLEKIYFDEWTSTLTDVQIEQLGQDAETKLRALLRDYVIGRIKEGRQTDEQLFVTNEDVVLQMGDNVKIKTGKEKTAAHIGKTFTVKNVDYNQNTLDLTDSSGQIYNRYQPGDVAKYAYQAEITNN